VIDFSLDWITNKIIFSISSGRSIIGTQDEAETEHGKSLRFLLFAVNKPAPRRLLGAYR